VGLLVDRIGLVLLFFIREVLVANQIAFHLTFLILLDAVIHADIYLVFMCSFWLNTYPRFHHHTKIFSALEEAISYIGKEEGWEESEDIYRKHFGLPTKYTPQ